MWNSVPWHNTGMSDDLLTELLPSWKRAMGGVNRSRATIELYIGGVAAFLRWCAANSVTPELTKDAVNAFIADLLESGAQPATAVARQKALRQYSKWLAAEGEIKEDPLLGLQRPQQMTKVTTALDDDELRRLIRCCHGTTFLDRRDEAVVRFMAETGVRAGELLALAVADVDLDRGIAVVRKAKGGNQRVVPFGPQTVTALDRYLRARRGITTAALWIGVHGDPLTYSGLNGAIKARAKAAGINGFHLHLLRHTAATRWLRAGGSEQGLMAVAGWSTRSMIDRYTGASAAERAAAEARTLGLGEL
jgi:site-specific recombinase XerD